MTIKFTGEELKKLEEKYNCDRKTLNRPLIINYVNKICALKVDEEGCFRWTQEFEDKIVSVRDIGEENWSIVEFADGSRYLMNRNCWDLAYPIGEWPKKESNPIGSHPDWEDYKADHIVGNEDNWDEESEWNVFCADRNID